MRMKPKTEERRWRNWTRASPGGYQVVISDLECRTAPVISCTTGWREHRPDLFARLILTTGTSRHPP